MGVDGQIRNQFRISAEPLGHAHEVLCRPLGPAELGPQPGPEMTVPQGILDGERVRGRPR